MDLYNNTELRDFAASLHQMAALANGRDVKVAAIFEDAVTKLHALAATREAERKAPKVRSPRNARV